MWKEKKRHITFKYQVTKKNHSIKKKKKTNFKYHGLECKLNRIGLGLDLKTNGLPTA